MQADPGDEYEDSVNPHPPDYRPYEESDVEGDRAVEEFMRTIERHRF
jgi:hypothetical protein